MENFERYIFITPVYFHEMSESAKTFFDRLKRCDAFKDDSKIKGKKIVCIACAGGSGSGTEETLNSFDTLNYFLRTNMIGIFAKWDVLVKYYLQQWVITILLRNFKL